MTRDVLEACGGIEQVVGEGETVFIKPNMVTLPFARYFDPFRSGECTKPEIAIAVAEECLRVGASEVIIGDGSQMWWFDWRQARTLDGSTNIVAEAARLSYQYPGKVTVASLEVDSPEWIDIPSHTDLGTIAVSSLVARADRVISIAVAKTHAGAQLTLSMKNFIGITPLERYGMRIGGYWLRLGFDHSSTCSIAEIYLDIVDALNPDLAIIDFSYGIEGDGPTVGPNAYTVDVRDRLGSWLLLASTDPVAADATAARIMSHDPNEITQLRLGYEMGLGEMRENRIKIVGERLDALCMEWTPAALQSELTHCPLGPPAHGARRRMAHRRGVCGTAELPPAGRGTQ
jgi:uncharacterized protein (DUF362 family)